MSDELKPCPFCGEKPELPSGDGTQYEIECDGCGQAMASVQICDLMTIEERAADEFTNYRYAEEFVERAKVEAIANWNRRAQPAEAEGVEVVAYVGCQARMTTEGWENGEEYLVFADQASDADKRYDVPLMTVAQHLAALSALSAERDRLRKEKGDPAGSFDKCMQAMRDRDEHAKTIDQLRAEVEELRVLLSKSLPVVEAHAGASHMLEGFRPTRNKWDELVYGIRAAMAAKEA